MLIFNNQNFRSFRILPSLPCEFVLYCNSSGSVDNRCLPSLPSENVLYYNLMCALTYIVYPSLPSENVLYYNRILSSSFISAPSLPSENVLYYNLKWHYRLLKDFNLSTNEESVILIHLYFRHFCQGP